MSLAAQLSMDAALERVSSTAWHAQALRAVDVLNAEGEPWTAETLRERAGDPPGTGNAIGALLRDLAEKRVIRWDGYVVAKRPEARGRILRSWTAP